MKSCAKVLLFITAAGAASSLHATEISRYQLNVATEMWWGKSKVDKQRYDTSHSPVLMFSFEHGHDYLPQLNFRYSQVDTKASSFDKYDYTLYYRLLDRDTMKFNAGVMLSQYRASRYQAPDQQEYAFNDLTFNWFGYAELAIPNTGLDIIGQIDFGENSDIKSADMTAGLQYRMNDFSYPIAVKFGYRVIDLEFSGLASSSQVGKSLVFVDGWFIGAEMSF